MGRATVGPVAELLHGRSEPGGRTDGGEDEGHAATADAEKVNNGENIVVGGGRRLEMHRKTGRQAALKAGKGMRPGRRN